MPVAVAVVLGAVLLTVGAALAVPLPELGLPLVLGGLRLLGRRYAWAMRANARVDAAARAVRDRWRRSSRVTRVAVVGVVAVVLAGVGWWAAVGIGPATGG